MKIPWRLARRAALISTILLVCAGLIAWFWPNASYDVKRVHPVIRQLREPFRNVLAHYYLDGGSISIVVVDATGREVVLAFPVATEVLDDGRITTSYESMYLGCSDEANRVELPFTQDSMNRAIEIADKFGLTYSQDGFERSSTLLSYRRYPRDAMRGAWWQLWCDFE